jgi:hypothetical protein
MDAIEKERRALCGSGCKFSDAAELVTGIGAVDPAEGAELVDFLNETAQVLVQELPQPENVSVVK